MPPKSSAPVLGPQSKSATAAYARRQGARQGEAPVQIRMHPRLFCILRLHSGGTPGFHWVRNEKPSGTAQLN